MKYLILLLALSFTVHADVFAPVDWPVSSFNCQTPEECELVKAVYDARNSNEARHARMGTAGDCAVVAKMAAHTLAARGISSEVHRVKLYTSVNGKAGHSVICLTPAVCDDNGYFGREGSFTLEGIERMSEYQGMERVRAENARGRY